MKRTPPFPPSPLNPFPPFCRSPSHTSVLKGDGERVPFPGASPPVVGVPGIGTPLSGGSCVPPYGARPTVHSPGAAVAGHRPPAPAPGKTSVPRRGRDVLQYFARRPGRARSIFAACRGFCPPRRPRSPPMRSRGRHPPPARAEHRGYIPAAPGALQVAAICAGKQKAGTCSNQVPTVSPFRAPTPTGGLAYLLGGWSASIVKFTGLFGKCQAVILPSCGLRLSLPQYVVVFLSNRGQKALRRCQGCRARARHRRKPGLPLDRAGAIP